MSHEPFANVTWFTVSLFRQLILIIELYNHYDVYDYLRQIALTLCSDKVSEVRWISYKLVSERKYWNMRYKSCLVTISMSAMTRE